MDGPFRVELMRGAQSGILDVFLIEDNSMSTVRQARVETLEQELLSSVAVAINSLLRHCQIHHLDSDELRKLKGGFKRFQQGIRRNIS